MYVQKTNAKQPTLRKPIIVIHIDNTIADIKGSAQRLGLTEDEFKSDIRRFLRNLSPVQGVKEFMERAIMDAEVHVMIDDKESNPVCDAELIWLIAHFKECITDVHVMKRQSVGDYFIHAEPVSIEDWRKDADIAFGSEKYPDWDAVLNRLEPFDTVCKWFDWTEYESR